MGDDVSFDIGGWFGDLLDDFGSGIAKAGSNAIDYFTTPEGVVRLGSLGLGYLGSQSNGFAQPQIPPTGYQGGVPALRAQRTQVPQGLGALAGPQGTGREAQMMRFLVEKYGHPEPAAPSPPPPPQDEAGASAAIEAAAEAGCDAFVAGSAVFKSDEPAGIVQQLRDLAAGA